MIKEDDSEDFKELEFGELDQEKIKLLAVKYFADVLEASVGAIFLY